MEVLGRSAAFFKDLKAAHIVYLWKVKNQQNSSAACTTLKSNDFIAFVVFVTFMFVVTEYLRNKLILSLIDTNNTLVYLYNPKTVELGLYDHYFPILFLLFSVSFFVVFIESYWDVLKTAVRPMIVRYQAVTITLFIFPIILAASIGYFHPDPHIVNGSMVWGVGYTLSIAVILLYYITPRFLLKFAVLFSGLYFVLSFCISLDVISDTRLSQKKVEETIWIREDYEKASMITVHLNGNEQEISGHRHYSDDKVLIFSNQYGTVTIPKSSILFMDTGRFTGDRHKIAH